MAAQLPQESSESPQSCAAVATRLQLYQRFKPQLVAETPMP
jgi:hypothetical protein